MSSPSARRRSPVDAARLRLAIAVGNIAAWASRLAGRGSGASVRGQVLTRMAPRAFAQLLQGRRILAVSGTNGKTTTTHLLAAALRAGLGPAADRVVTNADGANLAVGIASALSQHPGAEVAVLETDERVVPELLAQSRPEVLVLLNFSRDQLDRNYEIKALARRWRQALTVSGNAGPTVIANAGDPLIVWSCRTARRVIWVQAATNWANDRALCPECGVLLSLAENGWSCPGCGLAQPRADYRVDGEQIALPDGRTFRPDLQVPGSFNVSNSCFALAAALEFGIGLEQALAGMHTVTSPAGRFATARFGQTTARLLLAKNPAGWAEALPLALSDPLVLAIDALAADGRDLSWLWDVDFEQLRGRTVVCTGPRAQDLAVRLLYAEVEHRIEPDLLQAFTGLGAVDVVATYSPFQALLKMAGLR